MKTKVLNVMISKDSKYSSNLSTSTSNYIKFKVDETTNFVVIRCQKFNMISLILSIIEDFDKINIMLTEGLDISVLNILNLMRGKVFTLIVVKCPEWEIIRPSLNFCPTNIYLIDIDQVDALKFANLN